MGGRSTQIGFRTMILIMKKSETTPEENWKRGGPQRCLAKSPPQPTRTNGSSRRRLCASEWSKVGMNRLNSSCSKKEDHEDTIIESEGIRTTESQKKTRKDHISDRGHASMSHCNMVHQPIFLKQWKSQQQKLQWTKICVSGGWNTYLYVLWWLAQQFFFFILLKSRSYSGMEIMTLQEKWLLVGILLDSEKDRWLNPALTPEASENTTWNTCPEHIEDYKVGISNSAHTSVLWTTRFTRQQLSCSINQRMWPERLRLWTLHWPSRPMWQLPQTGSSATDHDLKQINHGKVIGNILAGKIHKTCGTHLSTTLVVILTQRDHSQETRWTQLTLLVNNMNPVQHE